MVKSILEMLFHWTNNGIYGIFVKTKMLLQRDTAYVLQEINYAV
jgi:hypothetical protein